VLACVCLKEINSTTGAVAATEEKFAGTPANLIPSMPSPTKHRKRKPGGANGLASSTGSNGKKKKPKPSDFVISNPRDFRQEIHVDFNSDIGFRGLPAEWEAMLRSGGISKDDVVNHSERVLEVLEFQANGMKPIPRTTSTASSSSSAAATTSTTSTSTSTSTTTSQSTAAVPPASPTATPPRDQAAESTTTTTDAAPAKLAEGAAVAGPEAATTDKPDKTAAGDAEPAEAATRKKKKKKKSSNPLEDGTRGTLASHSRVRLY